MDTRIIIVRNYRRDLKLVNNLLENVDSGIIRFPEIGEVNNEKYLKHPLELKEELMDHINNVKDDIKEITIMSNSTVVVNTLTYLEFKGIIDKLKIYYIDNEIKEIDVVKGFFYENGKEITFPDGFFDATLKEIFEINNF